MSEHTTDNNDIDGLSERGDTLPRSGIGFRPPHYNDMITERPDVGFLEVHSENYFNTGGIPYRQLEKLATHYPISLHGVGLSLGSVSPPAPEHLDKIKHLIDRFNPVLISEHLSWSGIDGVSVPDLLPLPMTTEALKRLSENIDKTQNALGRSILIENPSAYLSFVEQDMSEPEFLNQLCQKSGCQLLLDLNNIHVSGHNTGFDAATYLKQIDGNLVQEIHLAGYQINTVNGHEIFIDAHNNPVYDAVWELYDMTLSLFGDKPTLIEWDNDLPDLDHLVAEAHCADIYRQKYTPNKTNADINISTGTGKRQINNGSA